MNILMGCEYSKRDRFVGKMQYRGAFFIENILYPFSGYPAYDGSPAELLKEEDFIKKAYERRIRLKISAEKNEKPRADKVRTLESSI